MELNLTAYPKINIGLYIGGKRTDGFHNLISIFQLIKDSEYFDSINIAFKESDATRISVSGLEDFADCKNNTIYKATELYLQKTGISADITIKIKKRIPSLAGLGGGSADAGAVLLGLNNHLKKLTDKQLQKIALSVGSDVPFFVSNCETAIVEGRGELITPIATRKDIVFKLFSNKETKKSTGYAYAELDKRKIIPQLPTPEQLKQMYYGPLSEWNFTNDFQTLYAEQEGSFLTGSGTFRYKVQLT